MTINLQKQKILERGSVITLPCKNFLARTDYESPAIGQEINLDFSALLLDGNGKLPSENHFIFYGNRHSPDGSIEWFDDGNDPGATGEMTLGLDLTRVEATVLQVVLVLTIHEATMKNQTIAHLNRPYIRFCDLTRELYRFEPVGGESARSLELCRILRNGCAWVLVATGIGSPNEMGDYAMSHLPSQGGVS